MFLLTGIWMELHVSICWNGLWLQGFSQVPIWMAQLIQINSIGADDTVNSEIFATILFSRIALKDIFATLEIRESGMIYVYQ